MSTYVLSTWWCLGCQLKRAGTQTTLQGCLDPSRPSRFHKSLVSLPSQLRPRRFCNANPLSHQFNIPTKVLHSLPNCSTTHSAAFVTLGYTPWSISTCLPKPPSGRLPKVRLYCRVSLHRSKRMLMCTVPAAAAASEDDDVWGPPAEQPRKKARLSGLRIDEDSQDARHKVAKWVPISLA